MRQLLRFAMTAKIKTMGCIAMVTTFFQFSSVADDAVARQPAATATDTKIEVAAPVAKESPTTSTIDEEAAHQARIKRILQLRQEPSEIIAEPAGAEPVRTSVVAESSTSTDTQERLIEAIEQLQMEIRELRHDISRREAAAAENAVDDGPRGPESLETYQPKATFRK